MLRQIPNDYEFKAAQLKLEKNEIETLILGSSHSMYGFNPKYFKKPAFNLGHVSQTVDLDYHLLKNYIQELPKLENVILRMSYTTLHEQIKEGPEAFRLKDYNLYYNLGVSNNLKFQSEVLSVKLKNNVTRLYDYYFDDSSPINVTPKGWGIFENEHAEEEINVLGRSVAKKHTATTNELVKENSKFLEKIVQLCQKNNINIVLVTLPAHKSYIENLNQEQLNTVLTLAEKLEKKYNNCTYLNFLEHKDFKNKDFYDGDHLNKNGSKKLSLLVDEFLNNNITTN